MIKVILLFLIFVGGIGAIAAASRSAPEPTSPLIYPVVTGNKADRMSLVSLQDLQPTLEKIDLTSAPASEPSIAARPQPKVPPNIKAPEFIPRHWHDPNDTRANAKNPMWKRPSRTSRNNPATTTIAQTQECRSDGLSSLMRKLSLQPTCSR